MQAVWFEGGGVRVRDDVEVPQPQAGEALVRVRLAGVCGTDLQLLAGYADDCGIPGHEFVGEVVTGGARLTTSVISTRSRRTRRCCGLPTGGPWSGPLPNRP